MISTQIEKTDFSSPLPEKEQTRRDNLNAVKISPHLWSFRKKQLRVDWLELAGKNAPTLQYLLDEKAIGERKFIGIDTDTDVLDSCKDQYKKQPNVEWIHSKVTHFIQSNDSRLENVGVLNFDSFQATGEELRKDLNNLFIFAEDQSRKLKAFLLICNIAYKPKTPLEENTRDLAEYLSKKTKKHWTSEDILACKYVSKKTPMFNIQVKFGF